eukprot:m.194826 g.194826  ORF g.194826 m.194826 type:complete len:103 (-) comp13662_c0_seq4:4359-4667(-)
MVVCLCVIVISFAWRCRGIVQPLFLVIFLHFSHFLSSSNDDTLRLWDMSATACVDVFSCPSAPTCVASSSRTGLFCVGLSNGQVLQGKVDDSTHKVTSVSAL